MWKFSSLLLLGASLLPSAQAHDIVLRVEGKAVLGVSYPSDWKQTVGKNHVIATSEDGTAWSVISTLDEIKDQPAGVKKIKEGLEDYLTEIKYDDTNKTENGSLVLSGTGKGKKSGVDVVFTSALFMSGERHCGIVFIVDADIEKYYEETVKAICESILVEGDFADVSENDRAADTSVLYAQPWLVEEIGGGKVVDKSQANMRFADDASVSGDTSVNRYQGRATIEGSKISFGPLITTRRAGPRPLMDQETKFLKAMETVNQWRIEADGKLSLLNDKGDTVLLLSPMPSQENK